MDPADWLGLLERPPSEEPPALGAVDRRPEPDVPLDAVPERVSLAVAAALGRGLRQQGLQRGDLFVYGVEHRRHLVADVPELDGQPFAQGAPGARGASARRRRGPGWGPGSSGSRSYASCSRRWPSDASCCHARQGAADLAEGLVVELGAAAAALHQTAGLAQPGGGLVEVGHAALVVPLGHVVELEVLDASLEAVERVTGQRVRAGRGDSAEGARRDADAQPARGQALGQPRPGPQFAQRARPVGALRERCWGTEASAASPPAPSCSMASIAATSWARWTTLTSGSSSGLGQLAETLREGQQAALLGLFRSSRGRCGSLGLLGRRAPVRTAPPGPGRRRSPAGVPIRSRSLAAPPLVMTVDSPGGPEGCTL